MFTTDNFVEAVNYIRAQAAKESSTSIFTAQTQLNSELVALSGVFTNSHIRYAAGPFTKSTGHKMIDVLSLQFKVKGTLLPHDGSYFVMFFLTLEE